MEMWILLFSLFVLLFAQLPIHVGEEYWLVFLILVYLITFPTGPVQRFKDRLHERKHGHKQPCELCGTPVHEEDLLCPMCKLEASYRSYR